MDHPAYTRDLGRDRTEREDPAQTRDPEAPELRAQLVTASERRVPGL